jgi:hypothetical protein
MPGTPASNSVGEQRISAASGATPYRAALSWSTDAVVPDHGEGHLFFTSGQYESRLGVSELEARAMPAGEPKVIEVQFVLVEKVVTGSLLIEIAPIPYFAATRGRPRTPNTYR